MENDMIYTLTLNPSIDYIVSVKNFREGFTNRTDEETINPGGKGINVSLMLANLGVESEALGFCAGFSGEEILKLLKERGIKHDFIRLREGYSRINVKLSAADASGKSCSETEINGKGPFISDADMDSLWEKLSKLQKGDILIMAGAIPGCLSPDTYENIMKRLAERGVLFVVDATKELLLHSLMYHPFLIKPNQQELGELFDFSIETREEALEYAKQLQDRGAQNVMVSMGGDGAVLLASDKSTYSSDAPKGQVINSVGAGDAMVAGFLAGYLQTGNYESAFKSAVAAGSATAFSKVFATREEVNRLLEIL